jgi:hypothetical protein
MMWMKRVVGFWFTQYIALCAISTYYIYVIHYNLNAHTINPMNGKNYLDIAERGRQYLASMAVEGSPSKQYHILLAQLRYKAHRATPRSKSPAVRSGEEHPFDDPSSNYMTMQSQITQNSVPPLGDDAEGSNRREVNNMAFSSEDINMQVIRANNAGIDMLSTSSTSMMDFDALNLSWGYLDQLGEWPCS